MRRCKYRIGIVPYRIVLPSVRIRVKYIAVTLIFIVRSLSFSLVSLSALVGCRINIINLSPIAHDLLQTIHIVDTPHIIEVAS